MGIVNKIRLLLRLRKPAENLISEVSKVKSGYKSSEFWLTIVSNLVTIAGALNGILDAKTAAIVLAVLNGLYTVLRTIAKAGDTASSTTTVSDTSVTVNVPK